MHKTTNKSKVNTSKCNTKLQNNEKNVSDTNDLDMSELGKTNKSKTKNGLINGVGNEDKIKTSTKSSKKDKKHLKQKCEDKANGLKDCVLHSESVPKEKLEKNHINNNVETTDSHRCKPNVDKTVKASTSKVDTSQDKLELQTKGKSKSKSNVKSDSPTKIPIDFESPDFDITSYFRSKYNSEKSKKLEIKNDTTADKCVTDDLIKKVDNLNIKAEETVADVIEPIKDPIIEYVQYESELQMPMIMKIIQKDLSEPYSIYTYRYFIHKWPNLCFLVCNYLDVK